MDRSQIVNELMEGINHDLEKSQEIVEAAYRVISSDPIGKAMDEAPLAHYIYFARNELVKLRALKFPDDSLQEELEKRVKTATNTYNEIVADIKRSPRAIEIFEEMRDERFSSLDLNYFSEHLSDEKLNGCEATFQAAKDKK